MHPDALDFVMWPNVAWSAARGREQPEKPRLSHATGTWLPLFTLCPVRESGDYCFLANILQIEGPKALISTERSL